MGSNMMLTIGAILLFGMFLSIANRLIVGNTQIASQNEYYITGLSLAQSIIDEAKTKAFDQYTKDSTTLVARTSLTAWNALGREAGEVVPSPDTISAAVPYSSTNKGFMSAVKFNDVDDYNGYSRLVNTPRAEGFRLSVTVNYGSETNPDSAVSTKSYCKRMIVKVTSPFFRNNTLNGGPDTLTVRYVYTY